MRTTLLVAAGLMLAGCRAAGTELAMSQTPPTVRAAYADVYGNAPVTDVHRRREDGQAFYTVRYRSADGSEHDVVYNGAGDQIDGQ